MPNISSFSSPSTVNYETISDECDATPMDATRKPNGTCLKENETNKTNQMRTEVSNGGIWNRIGVGNETSNKAKLLYGLIAVSQLCLFMSWSILAPFYSPEAERQGASPFQIGFIFGIYSLIQFISSPIWGKFIPVLGARFVFIIGYIMTALVNIAFGFFDRTPPGAPFVITCLLARMFQGVGTSAVFTSAMTMVAYTFPNSVGRLVGLLEVFTGIGLMIGPFIGGVLYEVGGFMLPFVALGCLMLFTSFILILILPSDDYTDRHKSGSFLALLNIPGTWVGVMSGFIAALSFTVLEPTLSLELEKFNLNSVEIGLVFLLLGFVYGFSSPFFGWLAEKRVSSRIIVLVGMAVAVIGYLALGPWAPLNIPANLPLTCISIVVVSLSFGLAFAPSFQEILESATFNGMPSNLSTYSVLSGTFNSAYSLGSFIGPVIAGGLVQRRNFAFMSSVVALLNLIVFVSSLVVTIWEFNYGRGRRKFIISRKYEYTTISGFGEEVHLLPNSRHSA